MLWLDCRVQLSEILQNNDIAKPISDSFNIRSKSLLDNDALLAALYMDPRFNFAGSVFFSNEMREKAQVYV